MPTKKTSRNHSLHAKIIKDGRGLSPVISTIIVSGTLLIILVIASFVSANVLELQIASAEFEQAKTNMMLLDDVIQDVALRLGSGGYVQFNQRSGGIGIADTTERIKIVAYSYPITNMYFTNDTRTYLWNTKYIGEGTAPPVYYDNTTGNPSPGSCAGSYFHKATSSSTAVANISFTTETSFSHTQGTPLSVNLSYAYSVTGNSFSSTSNLIIKLIMPNLTTVNLDNVNLPQSAVAWTYKRDIVLSTLHFTQNGTYRLQVLNRLVAGAKGTSNWLQLNFDDIKLRMQHIIKEPKFEDPPLYSLVYRAGSHTSAADIIIRGNENYPRIGIVNMTEALGYLKVELDQGVKIKIDYYRIRAVELETLLIGNEYVNFIQVTFLRLVRGNMGGSGTVNVKLQNMAVQTTSYVFSGASVDIQTQGIRNDTKPLDHQDLQATKTVVMFTEIIVQVSTA